LRILAPMDRIGNTDGCNLDSCRNAVVENLYINNSDDGVCMKSGLDGYGMNLGIPTENVLVRNITCGEGGRCGFAIGSEISGGVRNVTYRDSVLAGSRGINIKSSIGRGGYVRDVLFENIHMRKSSITLGIGTDGVPIEPGNRYVPVIDNVRFSNVSGGGGCRISCSMVNGSACHGMHFSGQQGDKCHCDHCDAARASPRYTCKTTAKTQFGDTIMLPWGVCIPSDAPVNNDPNYPNWGPTKGDFSSLEACKAECIASRAVTAAPASIFT